MIHPMCGFPLQKGTALMAAIEIVFAILYLTQNAILLSHYIPRAMEERHYASLNPTEKSSKFDSMKSVIILLDTAYWVSSLLLGILLYLGTKQRDLRKCRQWFILTCILTVLFIVDILMQTFSMRASLSEIASPVVGTFLLTYMIWVVSAFMDELRLGGCIPIKSSDVIAQ